MATSYTPIGRLPQMVTGDSSVFNAWGAIINSALICSEQLAAGNTPISLTAVGPTYTLTTVDDGPDQARLGLLAFTGTLTGNCTVTIPSVARFGWASNGTSGGFSVILTTGAGTTLTIPPGYAFLYSCDATNVTAVPFSAPSLAASATSGTVTATIDGAAGNGRQLRFTTAQVLRWISATNNTAESGSNAGSDYRLSRYSDAGSLLGNPIQIARSTGAITLDDAGAGVILGGGLTTAGNVTVPNADALLGLDTGATARNLIGVGNTNVVTIGDAALSNVVVNATAGANFIPLTDNAMNCGIGGNRWVAVYAVNGTIQTSDGRTKQNIVDSSLGLGFIMALRPVRYEWSGGSRPRYGFISQEVKRVIDTLGIDFDGWRPAVGDMGREGLAMDQFIAPLVLAVQQLADRVRALEARLG